MDEKKGRKTKARGSSVVEHLGGPGFPLPCSEKRGEEERSMYQMLWLISDEKGGAWTELSSVSETRPL